MQWLVEHRVFSLSISCVVARTGEERSIYYSGLVLNPILEERYVSRSCADDGVDAVDAPPLRIGCRAERPDADVQLVSIITAVPLAVPLVADAVVVGSPRGSHLSPLPR